jgi:hypothetical protein
LQEIHKCRLIGPSPIYYFLKEVARGEERARVLLISFIFSFFTTLLLSKSASPIRQFIFIFLNLVTPGLRRSKVGASF